MNTQDIIGLTVASVEQSKVDCRVQVSIRFTDGSSLVVYTEEAPRGTVSMSVWLEMEIVESLKSRVKPSYRHSCPKWDFMVIDSTMPEFDSCPCRFAS